jgi:hypothetical protein
MQEQACLLLCARHGSIEKSKRHGENLKVFKHGKIQKAEGPRALPSHSKK